ncbi:Hypothetical protein FKW44_015673, partial [Caligus rogercresseyi]
DQGSPPETQGSTEDVESFSVSSNGVLSPPIELTPCELQNEPLPSTTPDFPRNEKIKAHIDPSAILEHRTRSYSVGKRSKPDSDNSPNKKGNPS